MSDDRLWLAAIPWPLPETDARAYGNLKDPTPADPCGVATLGRAGGGRTPVSAG
ncbi:hypothetical protein AB0K53_14230 [Streptomyces tuirus]|uniref:hypothetical protein n=1 Tax=Streptomyces tuirus TaxID=68278 RepID=UPI00343DC75F